MQILNVQIAEIKMLPRLRALSSERVIALKASLSEVGLLNPINICARPQGEMVLAAGAHRLQAARELDWESIPAVVMDVAEVDRMLVEIDENLCRSELSPAERARHEARRKELWTSKYDVERPSEAASSPTKTGDRELGGTICPTQLPEDDRQGGEPWKPTCEDLGVDARGHRKSLQQKPGFAASTAAITGENKRVINRNVRRGEELGGETLNAITGTSLDKGFELDALMKLQPEERVELVNRAKTGEEVSARQFLEAKIKTPEANKSALAKRAVTALEKCSAVMEPSEFAAAVGGMNFAVAIVPFAKVLAALA